MSIFCENCFKLKMESFAVKIVTNISAVFPIIQCGTHSSQLMSDEIVRQHSVCTVVAHEYMKPVCSRVIFCKR